MSEIAIWVHEGKSERYEAALSMEKVVEERVGVLEDSAYLFLSDGKG